MKKRFVVLVVAFALVFGVVAGVSAAPIMERISADLNWSIKFVVDGKEWTPRDPGGNKLAPINYRGSNYLPVRAVAEVFNIAVDWDGENQTIYLGEKTDSVLISHEEVKPDHSSFVTTDKQYTVQDGTDYQAGIVMENINSTSRRATLVPNNRYQMVELNFFGIDLKNDVDVQIVGKDNVTLKRVILSSSHQHDSVEVDIGGQTEISIRAVGSPGGSDQLFVSGTYR